MKEWTEKNGTSFIYFFSHGFVIFQAKTISLLLSFTYWKFVISGSYVRVYWPIIQNGRCQSLISTALNAFKVEKKGTWEAGEEDGLMRRKAYSFPSFFPLSPRHSCVRWKTDGVIYITLVIEVREDHGWTC